MIDVVQVAKQIRKELKTQFPTVKFSVRSDRFSGGQMDDNDRTMLLNASHNREEFSNVLQNIIIKTTFKRAMQNKK